RTAPRERGRREPRPGGVRPGERRPAGGRPRDHTGRERRLARGLLRRPHGGGAGAAAGGVVVPDARGPGPAGCGRALREPPDPRVALNLEWRGGPMDRRSPHPSAHAELVRMVRSVRQRWRTRLAVRGAAILAAVVLAGFLLTALLLERLQFAPGAIVVARGALALLLVAA